MAAAITITVSGFCCDTSSTGERLSGYTDLKWWKKAMKGNDIAVPLSITSQGRGSDIMVPMVMPACKPANPANPANPAYRTLQTAQRFAKAAKAQFR